jgi:hypothetical protein
MNEPRAYGTFIKRGKNIYRTSAFIQWGDSEKSIGACLLRNPGSVKLDHKLTATLNTSGSASGWIKSESFDPTMNQLVYIVEEIYGNIYSFSGRLHIYNLFNLRNTELMEATDEFELLVQSGEYKITESLVSQNELQSHPWLLLGWGIEKNKSRKNLQLIKEKWQSLIVESKVPTFGKKHKEKDDYYHVCPRITKERTIRANELIAIYKRKFDFDIIRFPKHATMPNLIIESKPVEKVDVFAMFEDGWFKSHENPENIVMGFSHLRIMRGYKLRAYQYRAGGNGNGVVWAIPIDKTLPDPTEHMEYIFKPKPDYVLTDFMEAVEGDRTPMSYLQASVVYHELHEFGAMWHGVSWGRDVILPDSQNEGSYMDCYEWDMLEEEPAIIEPHFYYNREGNPVIVFYTINDIGTITLNRYIHVFSKDDYTVKVERTCIAEAGGGIIF